MAKSRTITKLNLPKIPLNRDTKHIPSRDSGSGIGARKDTIMYTGTNIIGIGTLHKSNAVPIFSQQEAKDISAMRR